MSGVVLLSAAKREDVTGRKFGRLTAVQLSSMERRDAYWMCRCDCGSETVVALGKLRLGKTVSCGCAKADANRTRNLQHGGFSGEKATPEYSSWQAMKARCLRESHEARDRYAGRGIVVCDRWLHGEDGKHPFQCFLEDMGPRPAGTTLDRVNNDGGYEPSNCRWATPKEQAQNRRPPRRRKAA